MNNEKKAPVRQIKFRGLRVDGKGWVYGLIVKRKAKYFIEVEFTDLEDEVIYRAYEVIPETVGQFTGLLDKNGKEIYEGDTISSDDKYFNNSPVFWDNTFSGYNINPSVTYKAIITGNIHKESDINSIEGKETNS